MRQSGLPLPRPWQPAAERLRPGRRRRRRHTAAPAAPCAAVARELAEADWTLAPEEAWPAWLRVLLVLGASAALWAALAGAVRLLLLPLA